MIPLVIATITFLTQIGRDLVALGLLFSSNSRLLELNLSFYGLRSSTLMTQRYLPTKANIEVLLDSHLLTIMDDF